VEETVDKACCAVWHVYLLLSYNSSGVSGGSGGGRVLFQSHNCHARMGITLGFCCVWAAWGQSRQAFYCWTSCLSCHWYMTFV